MLDIHLIRNRPEIVEQDLEKRRDEEKLAWLTDLIKKDQEARILQNEIDDLRHNRNKLSDEVRKLKKEGKDVNKIIKQAKELPEMIKRKEEKLQKLKDKVSFYLHRLPNVTHDTVPYGKDSTENVTVREKGTKKKFNFPLKSHAELAEDLGAADFERSAKVAGAGFYYLKGDLALLNQALIRFAIDHLIKKRFTYVEPPLMMRRKPYEGVTDLADFEDVMYKIEGSDHYMIATSEHPIGAMLMNETIPEKDLPLKFAGYSMCFRKEIGSHGIDTKGLFRTHQFNKVEQFVFCKPEDSWKIHEELLKNSEEIFAALKIPYRIVNICTGDIGTVAAKKYDLEIWSPRQEEYIEACSCSNCTDYQARRLNIKCGKEGGQKALVHTLNNTAIATSRALVAILEQYQNIDGSVTVPKVLEPYMNGIKKIKPVK